MACSDLPGKISLKLKMKSSRNSAFFNQKISISNGWKLTFIAFSSYFCVSSECVFKQIPKSQLTSQNIFIKKVSKKFFVGFPVAFFEEALNYMSNFY
jgi:hypothetical protein